jgi:hypothetical protein
LAAGAFRGPQINVNAWEAGKLSGAPLGNVVHDRLLNNSSFDGEQVLCSEEFRLAILRAVS